MLTETVLDRVLIGRFADLTGYTQKAVRRKIEEGVWLEGLHWFRNPDGRITMSLSAYTRWQQQKPRKPPRARASKPVVQASA
jgi:hypothetical protein